MSHNVPKNELLHPMSIIPTLHEVKLAIKHLSISRSPALDGITVELLHLGVDCVSAIFDLITLLWEGTTVPQDGLMKSWFQSLKVKIQNL